MKIIRGILLIGLSVLTVFFIVGCGSPDEERRLTEDGSGGELNIAINAQPPSLDPQVTTATATRDTARMMFESMMVMNTDFEPVLF